MYVSNLLSMLNRAIAVKAVETVSVFPARTYARKLTIETRTGAEVPNKLNNIELVLATSQKKNIYQAREFIGVNLRTHI